jgi:hypothetical protein
LRGHPLAAALRSDRALRGHPLVAALRAVAAAPPAASGRSPRGLVDHWSTIDQWALTRQRVTE